MPQFCVLAPATPYTLHTVCAADVHLPVAWAFGEYEIYSADRTKTCAPIAVSLLKLKEVLELIVRQTEFKVVVKSRQPPARRKDLKHFLRAKLLHPSEGSWSPVDDKPIPEVIKRVISIQVVEKLVFVPPSQRRK